MKTGRPAPRVARWLFGLFLCALGLFALIVVLMLGFGWIISETKPSTTHKVITGSLGLVVFASSIACFLSARRQFKYLKM